MLATVSLFIGTRDAWTRAIHYDPPVAAVISAGYAGILVCGVLSLCVTGRRALGRVDAAVLGVALALAVCAYWLDHGGTDEGVLTAQAASEIVHGRPVYGSPWPWLFELPRVGLTRTMSGGGDYTYAYPPLAALLTAPVRLVVHSTAAATLVTTAALVAGTLALWRLLPAPWRSAATAVCLGFGLLPHYARAGYPALVAFALLVPVVVRWQDTGAGGRLGRRGLLRACCLGAACAAQQLAWAFAPFLLVGIHAVRRGDPVPGAARSARAVTARYAGVAALTCLVLNAYVALQGPRAWLGGMLLPFTQGAILHGQGLMGISYYFTSGSGRLDFYSYASLLLLLGLLAALALFVRRLGPALTVLPWLPFYLATRSQDGYYLLMTPLWLAAAVTVPTAALATAWQPALPRPLAGRRVRAAVAVGLVLPAALCATVAAASPPPLRMTLTPRFTEGSRHGITSLAVRAVNTTGARLTPHFASRTGQGASPWWPIRSGPPALGPHASASYVLRPPHGLYAVARGPHMPVRLIAVTDGPMTVTTALVPTRHRH
ncbi:hypothetical protein [Streptomyces fuscigenes]|uniref:hypothetical protein n=1 Tax=Streptomyces fuscigenes TaxID=1528880 RepID=UPI0027DEF66F|nr:hypothetical protein [Streptomyces fuscigenes]